MKARPLINSRVLLIESDSCIQETIRYYLAESGHTVVAIQDSRDALRAVMSGDFALVLYDPMSPGLESDAFYKGVRRLDPELCERLVFLIGDHVDARTIACIKGLDGFVLRKPFDSLDLLDAIFSAEASGTFEGVFERSGFLPDPLPPDDGGETPVAVADPAGTRLPKTADAAPSQKGQVLLIEADPCFRETVRYYLTETGYTVMEFQNNRDALREVLSGDFALVLFDPTTPGLPADMFYQGVRRIDPELCERLVFLLGDRHDALTSAFIRKIDGFVLRKPFDAKMLADKISASEVLGTLQGAFESASTDPGLSRDCLSVDDVMATGKPRPHVNWFAETLAEPPADAPTVPEFGADFAFPWSYTTPKRLSDVIPALEAQAPLPGVVRVFAFAVLALLGVLLGTQWNQYRDARASAATASAKHDAIEAEWMTTSRDLQNASAARPRIEAEIRKLERLADNRAMPRWSPALRFLVPPRDAKIDILEVHARGHAEDLGAFEVRIHGVAGGSQPRVIAERFRQTVEASFKASANGRPARARFESLEDVTGAPPDKDGTAFLMIATVDAFKTSVLISKEGR